jgi:NAD(P)-dependent dehydrogenase (short-subunit alcohol dehydrogenase family)
MRTILITGAGGNLGSTTLKKFLSEGWKVVAVVSPETPLILFEDLSNAEVIQTNAFSEAEVLSCLRLMAEKHGTMDAAVLTIGGYSEGTISETSEAQIQEMMKLNFFTAWHFVKPLFQQMVSRQKGHLVVIGSQAGINLTEGTYAVAYSVAKTALAKLAALLNESGKKHNVMCSLVSPGILDTPQNRMAMPEADFSRWQKPESIAEEIFQIINR